MRTILLTLLIAVQALPALAQNDADEWRSFLAGSWTHADASPELYVEIDTTTGSDTLRLKLLGRYAPPGVNRETIECTLNWPRNRRFSLSECPQTTLVRTVPPRDSTLRFHPQSKEGRGLRRVVQQFTSNPERRNDTLTVGREERFRLVKQP